MKKRLFFIVGSVLAALIAAGVLCWYFLCVQLQGIFIETLPIKVEYYIGEDFNSTGLHITKKRRLENFNREVSLSDVKISGFDSQTPCERQEVVVTYKGESASFFVKINDLPEVQKAVIKIQLVPEEGYEIKTDYYLFEPLDISHMRLLVTYSDQSTEIIPVQKEYVSGYDNREHAENLEVRITYQGFFTRLYVNIVEPPQEA